MVFQPEQIGIHVSFQCRIDQSVGFKSTSQLFQATSSKHCSIWQSSTLPLHRWYWRFTTEDTDDYIVSFYIAEQPDSMSGRSITLIRDRKWESLVAEEDKGVEFSDEALHQEFDSDDFLDQITFSDDVVRILTTEVECELDLGRVDNAEVVRAQEVLEKMNYDKRFQLVIA